MSKALDFLSHARPDAMGHYFAFLKAAGSRLDPKTRNLISVITKVHAQTERGLRQYARRAIRDGSSPEEIVDALLMAFPALGLSRILWAVDILIDMDLLSPAALDQMTAPTPPDGVLNPSDPASWHDVADLDTVLKAEAGSSRVDIADTPILLQSTPDGIRAFDARCPHQGTVLAPRSTGPIVCPKHQWRFDPHSGVCKNGPTGLREYQIRVAGSRVEVRLTDA